MGDGYGPMVISVAAPGLHSDDEIRKWLRGRAIAIPGKMTSAFLALQLYLGEFEFIVVPFEQIFDAVKSRRAAAGLIILDEAAPARGRLPRSRVSARRSVATQ